MREDFAKILIERARSGSSHHNTDVTEDRALYKAHKSDTEALEEMPGKDPMRRFSWSRPLVKSFSDNLNPLRRFLKSSVGRLWDDVYSELREHIDPKSTIQNHILEHLWHYVERDVVLDEDGQPYSRRRDGYGPLYKSRYGSSFYIHPLNGELLEPPSEPKRPKRYPWGYDPDKVALTETTFLHKIKSIWYFVERAETKFLDFYGRLLQRESFTKRQLNKKELKKYGLQND